MKGSPVHLRDPLTDLQYCNTNSFREFMSTADKTSRSQTSWKSSSSTVIMHYPGLYLNKRKTAEKQFKPGFFMMTVLEAVSGILRRLQTMFNL